MRVVEDIGAPGLGNAGRGLGKRGAWAPWVVLRDFRGELETVGFAAAEVGLELEGWGEGRDGVDGGGEGGDVGGFAGEVGEGVGSVCCEMDIRNCIYAGDLREGLRRFFDTFS